MKKILLGAFMLFSVMLQAQEEENQGFQKGDFFISGNVSFSTFNNSDIDVDVTSFSILPSVGYFISDHFALGASLGYSSTKNETAFTETTDNSFTGGVFGQYVFTPAKKFSFTGTLALNYLNTDFDTPGGGDASIDTFQASLAPGIYYFLSKSFAITSSVGVLSYQNIGGDADASSFTLSLNPDNLNFGLLFKF
ncbi:outer membrane beta-barrel protein [Flavobacteriaceae bacterium R38]|nr:outer membrane beta-barrel protein [Flavobacteriaceae bacterium R38]